MAFFKADPSLVVEDTPEPFPKFTKLRYVIDDNGKGFWVRPVELYSTDYDEDIDY